MSVIWSEVEPKDLIEKFIIVTVASRERGAVNTSSVSRNSGN